MKDNLRTTWDEIPDEYKDDYAGYRHDTHYNDYGLLNITQVMDKGELKPRYLKVKFRPDNLTSKIKRLLGFSTLQELELGIAELEKYRNMTSFSDDNDQKSKNLSFLSWKAEEEYGRNSPIHKAINQVQFTHTIIKSDDIDLSEVY